MNFDKFYSFLAVWSEPESKREPEPFVISVAPERMNERFSIQQGLFLAPCDISAPFEQTSASLFPGLDGFARSLYHETRLMSER